MRSIVFGIIMIIGGASGKLVLIGTNSSTALVVVGVAMAAFGVFQMMSKKNTASPSNVASSIKSGESTGIKK
jgi:predicted phage tail protein